MNARLVTDKFLSGQLLHQVGFMTAPKWLCSSLGAPEFEFLRIHQKIVVKPNSLDRGVGVFDNVSSKSELESAFQSAKTWGPVLLEKQVFGREYRILIIGDQAAACLERKPLVVVGDGKSSIQELLKILNQDPQRGPARLRKPLRPIPLDERWNQRLAKQGLNLDSRLEKGRVVQISFSNHLDSGGVACDRTRVSHVSHFEQVQAAVHLFGLDVAGVDYICPDITQPLSAENPGFLLEINPGPDLLWHLYPAEGESQPVSEAFVEYLFSISP